MPNSIHLKSLFILLALGIIPLLNSCTCCVYYNHFFNAEKAFRQGEKLRAARLDSIPDDSNWISKAEEEKYDRVIEKCSKVLERYPLEVEYKPKALYLIGISFFRKGEWESAITKFDEYEKYFPEYDSIPGTQYHRAYSLYKANNHAMARFALEPVLNPEHPYHEKGLELLANLKESSSSGKEAIAALEALLALPDGDPWLRARARLRLGKLYFADGQYSAARKNLLADEITELNPKDRYDAALLAVLSLQKQDKLDEALREMAQLLESVEYQDFRIRSLLELARLKLEKQDYPAALDALLEVVSTDPGTALASESFFLMGNHEQFTARNLPLAKVHYDSCASSFPQGKWTKTAKERSKSIDELMTFHKKNAEGKLGAKEEFLMAELFLFNLDETDSALQALERIVASQPEDSLVVLRAAYAQAFIYDEFKKDKARSDSLYRLVLKNYPGTEYARQAQINLGLPVTVRIREDEAHDAFRQAESLYEVMKSTPPDSIALVDSLYSTVLLAYDSVDLLWSGTDYAARAIFAKAWLLENEVGDMDSARASYSYLQKAYPDSPYGKVAQEKLAGKVDITDEVLEKLKKEVAAASRKLDNTRAARQYQERFHEKRREQAEEEELLEYDYERMYDF